MSKLILIKGGKVSSGGGGGKGGGSKKSHKPRRPHSFNNLLFKACSRIYYNARATSIEEISQRMTKLSKRVLGYHVDVRKTVADHCVLDGRKRRIGYGWFLLNAQKGSIGLNRGYIPVLCDVDVDDFEIWLIEDTDIPYVVAGLISALGTEASMLEVTADGMAFAAGAREAAGHKWEDLRDLGEDAKYIARRMRKLALASHAL